MPTSSTYRKNLAPECSCCVGLDARQMLTSFWLRTTEPYIPHLSYALPFWGHESQKKQFHFILQRLDVQIGFSLPRQHSCKNLFRESWILTFPSIYILETLSFVKENTSTFNFSAQNPYSLRNINKFPIPKYYTAFFQKHFLYNGVKLFNSLPSYSNLKQIIQNLKKYSNLAS